MDTSDHTKNEATPITKRVGKFKFKKMKKTLLFTIGVIFSFTISAQWTTLNTGTTATFTGVSCPVIDTGYAVTSDFGIGGKIFATTDGITWNQQYTSADYLFTIFFISAKVGWAGGGIIGSNGVILKTTDGGLNWNSQPANVQQICSIYFINDTTGWAIGNDGTQATYFIYNTTNGGNTWNVQKTGIGYVHSVFFRNNLLGWVAGNNGRIFHTTDGGLNWDLQNTGVVFHFKSICFVSDSLGWSVGHYGTGGCYTTAYDSLDWSPQNIGTSEILTSTWFTSANTGWAVGKNGKIISTIDGGEHWLSIDSPTNNTLLSIHFPDSTIGYAVGETGTILKYGALSGISKTKNKFNP